MVDVVTTYTNSVGQLFRTARHQERADPTHDSETAGCGSRSNKKHQRAEGKQAGGQYQSNVARQCCNQDWKQENGERGNAKTLQKLPNLATGACQDAYVGASWRRSDEEPETSKERTSHRKSPLTS